MPVAMPAFTLGVEEEYLLVDRKTRKLASEPPAEMLAECESQTSDLVRPEFLKSQIEIATNVCQTLGQARKELAWLRKSVSDIAGKHGLAPIAASTHPFSEWSDQVHTDKERYNALANDLQDVARRLLIGGMHVHIGIEDESLRLDLMNQAAYFLPHLLALSTSSPFWRGRETGLKSYRLSVFDELPRTGLPEQFASYSEYMRHINVLTQAGVINDASMIWWDIRPSARFPTIEMRITDVCTRLDDAIAVAALFLCIVHMLYRLRRSNQRWRTYATMLINENRWRAQRYGLDEGMVDFGQGQLVPFAELLDELLELVAVDIAELGCEREIAGLHNILARGTSAHQQINVYHAALDAGKSDAEALAGVVDFLIDETLADL